MANWVQIRDLKGQAGQEVLLKGWITHKRGNKKLLFLQMRDGTGFVQCVASKADLGDDLFSICQNMVQECSVEIQGLAVSDERAKGGVEIQVQQATLIGDSQDYPIANQAHGPDFLLNHRHLWIRSKRQHAILSIRARVHNGLRRSLDDDGFTLVDSPIFTPNACEGTSTLFAVPYSEDTTAYLTQSGQLYNEANAAALGRVYCCGPTFRAEKSKTRKHLREFWMLEGEMSFCDFDELMDIQEKLVKDVLREVLEKHQTELEHLERDTEELSRALEKDWPRITYHDAVEKIKARDVEMTEGDDFGAPQEEALATYFDTPHFVTHWPTEIKAFYMARDPKDPSLCLGADLMAPGGFGELSGGSVRSIDLDYLESQIEKHDLPKEAFEWYLDLRRYGAVPHAGFGIGVERLVSWIVMTEHIRECIPYPRMLHRISP